MSDEQTPETEEGSPGGEQFDQPNRQAVGQEPIRNDEGTPEEEQPQPEQAPPPPPPPDEGEPSE